MICCVSLLLFAAPLWAQDNWEALNGLKAGERIGVVGAGMKRIEGEFQAIGPDAITLRVEGKETTVARSQVARVYRRAAKRSPRNLAIGIAAGVGVGLVLDRTVGVRFRNEGDHRFDALVWALPIGLGAAAGGLPKVDITVYRASKR